VSAVVRVAGLEKRFGDFRAVKGVSFEVEQGEIFGYLGANGAGKSTTIRILCGLLEPTAGTAEVAGLDVAKDPVGVRYAVGYMSQKFSLYPDLTARENLDFFGGVYRLPRKARLARAEELLHEVGLSIDDPRLTADMPGGVRQRLSLVASLLHRPKVVFLDEPTAGVDPAARRAFWRIIRKLSADGTTIFVTTHYMDEAEYCGRVGLMVGGELVALDTPSGLKRAHVPGRIVLVRGARLDAAIVSGLPGLLAVEPFGAGLHVRGDADRVTPASVMAALAAAGRADATVEEVPPTLEDVFLALAGRR
jgi:ABC-2 type transport system ATP-binding protein